MLLDPGQLELDQIRVVGLLDVARGTNPPPNAGDISRHSSRSRLSGENMRSNSDVGLHGASSVF